MKPIYFPYTYVSSETAEAAAACFEQMIVYQPSGLAVSGQMVESEKKGLLDIRVPAKGDEKKILTVLKDYKRWADVHKDGDGISLALHDRQKDQIPFFSESSIMKIREDIQRKINKADTVQNESDPFLTARAFLHMAYEFDMQNDDINSGIRHLDMKEHELMKNLQGGEAVFDNGGIYRGEFKADTQNDFMVLERIKAWSALMLHDQKQNEGSGLFVTSNRSVFAYIVENIPTGEMVLEVKNIPVGENRIAEMKSWRDSLMKNIQKCIREPWPVTIDEKLKSFFKEESGRKISLSLYIVPGENFLDFFVRFYPHKLDNSYKYNEDQKNTNILFGLFEIQP